MFGFRKKKKDLKENREHQMTILKELVLQMQKAGYSTKQIKKEFERKNYPEEFVDFLLELNYRRLKMGRKSKEEYEDEDDEPEEDEELDEDDEDDEEVSKIPVKKAKETKPVKEPEITVESVLRNHEQRIQALEASLFRIKAAA